MLIAAALIEMAVPDAESIKARRRVASALKDRIQQRFNVSVAEVGDPDERHEVVLGCALVGSDPRQMRERMERVVRYVEGIGIAELVDDDIVVVRLDEVPLVESPDTRAVSEERR